MATPTSKPATAKPKVSAADSLLAAAKTRRGTGLSAEEVHAALAEKDAVGVVQCPACGQSTRLENIDGPGGAQLVLARVAKFFRNLTNGEVESLRPAKAQAIRTARGRE